MGDERLHPAVARIAREHGDTHWPSVLGEQLSGSDLTSLMLDVMTRRVDRLTPATVLDQYERDRFVRPAPIDPLRLLDVERSALSTVTPPFEPIASSPLAPLGTHAAVAGVHQNRVVTTTRGSEVAADPTNTLALEAAVRRRTLLAADPRSREAVHLASADRVVRAQQFDGGLSFAHFTLLGLVSAGRDTGDHEFEVTSMRLHLRTLVAVCARAGFERASIRLTDFGATHHGLVQTLAADLADEHVTAVEWPQRTGGQGYYPTFCFKLGVMHGEEDVEVADGGLVNWTQRLLSNRKERLMISGLSLERLAVLASE
jgi:hypothetical protein